MCVCACEFPSASLARHGAGLDAHPPSFCYKCNRFYNELHVQIKSAPLPVVIPLQLTPLGGYQTADISDSVEQPPPLSFRAATGKGAAVVEGRGNTWAGENRVY